MKRQVTDWSNQFPHVTFTQGRSPARPTIAARAPRRARLNRLALVAAALLALILQSAAQTPVGTTFTYQGRLTDNGNPAIGSYDLRFILYDAPAGGAQVGPILTVDDQTVTDGLFTVPLDFGAAAFAGQARWLEVSVRAGTSIGTFSVLSPRQELTTMPQAIFAATATTAATANTATIAASYSGTLLRIESDSNPNNPVLEIKDNSPGQARVAAINFLQTNNTVRGQIAYQNPDGPMTFRVGGTTRATLNATGLDVNAGQIAFGSVEGFKDAGVNCIGTLGVDSLAIGGRIRTGANTNAFAWNQFGNGTKSDALIADVNDVYVSGDVEIDGTLISGGVMNVPDGFTLNVAGSPANLTIAGANAVLQIGDSVADKVGIGRTPTANSLEVAGNASKAAAGSWLANSDRRLKTEIQDLHNALEVIDRLRPVKFRYSPEFFQKYPGSRDVCYYNYIAQEYREVFPDSVQDDGEGYLQLDTHNAEVYSVAAIQELHRALKEKDAQIARLEEQMQALRETVNSRLAAPKRSLTSSPVRE